MTRLCLAVLFFISILYLPWWMSVALALLLAVVCRAYEILFGGIAMDALYGVPGPFPHIAVWYTLLFSLFFFVAEYLRPRLR